jgi:hypothetical protein
METLLRWYSIAVLPPCILVSTVIDLWVTEFDIAWSRNTVTTTTGQEVCPLAWEVWWEFRVTVIVTQHTVIAYGRLSSSRQSLERTGCRKRWECYVFLWSRVRSRWVIFTRLQRWIMDRWCPQMCERFGWWQLAYIFLYECVDCCTDSKCLALSSPLYGEVIITDSGQLATYTCNKGYSIVGDTLRKCSNGRWTGSVPSCNTFRYQCYCFLLRPILHKI